MGELKLMPLMPISGEKYLKLITDAVAVCADYRTKFRQGRQAGLTLAEFQERYEADEFYSWFGLSSPLLRGTTKGTSLDSAHVFCKEVAPYDLVAVLPTKLLRAQEPN